MVLAGIQDAYKSGIPLKTKLCSNRGENTDELSEFFSWAKRKQIAVRFIEMMPIGYGKTYKSVPSDEILRQFLKHIRMPIVWKNRWEMVRLYITVHLVLQGKSV